MKYFPFYINPPHARPNKGLLDDAFYLARSGVLDYSITFRLALYLVKERDYLPWKTALNALSYVDLMLKRTPVYEKFQVKTSIRFFFFLTCSCADYGCYFQKFMLTIVLPMYNILGFDGEKKTMIHDLRADISKWACQFKHGDCFANAVNLFRTWKQHPQAFKE